MFKKLRAQKIKAKLHLTLWTLSIRKPLKVSSFLIEVKRSNLKREKRFPVIALCLFADHKQIQRADRF